MSYFKANAPNSISVGWGSAPDPAEELTVTALPKQRSLHSLLDFRGSTSNGRERKWRSGVRRGGEGERRRRKGRGGEEKSGRGREGISLPHGRHKTLAALRVGLVKDEGNHGLC